MKLRSFIGVAVLGLIASGQKCSDLEKRVCGEGKLVNRDGQIKCVYEPKCPGTGDPRTWCGCWSNNGRSGGEWMRMPDCGPAPAPESPSPSPSPVVPSPIPTPVLSPPMSTPRPPSVPPPAPPEVRCVPQRECAASQSEPGIYGCCSTHVAGGGTFSHHVEAILDDLIRERGTDVVFRDEDSDQETERKENAFVAEVAKRLRLRGLCATTKQETPGGGTPDEVGVRSLETRFSEQYDIVLSGGRIRRNGFVAQCQPARFDD